MQGSSVLTQYMNDQLKEDMRRDELVADGKMSQMAADEEALLWSEVRMMYRSRKNMFALGWMSRKTIAEI
jgi:hypothetical protein